MADHKVVIPQSSFSDGHTATTLIGEAVSPETSGYSPQGSDENVREDFPHSRATISELVSAKDDIDTKPPSVKSIEQKGEDPSLQSPTTEGRSGQNGAKEKSLSSMQTTDGKVNEKSHSALSAIQESKSNQSSTPDKETSSRLSLNDPGLGQKPEKQADVSKSEAKDHARETITAIAQKNISQTEHALTDTEIRNRPGAMDESLSVPVSEGESVKQSNNDARAKLDTSA